MPEIDPQNSLLSVIIPCYNEEQLIAGAYSELSGVLQSSLEKNSLKDYEILFIDDGSSDRTPAYLTDLAGKDARVKVITFSRRFGKEAALSAGLAGCQGDLALLLDADLQDPPALIPQLLAEYKLTSCPIIYGVRTKRRGENWLVKGLAKLYYRLLRLLAEIPIPVDSADFKLLDRQAITAFRRFKEQNKYIRGLICWSGFSQQPFYYERQARRAGQTKYSLAARFKLASRSIFYFTVKPLKLIKWLGIICFPASGGVLWLAPSYGLNLTLHLIFTGIQLLALGVIGEYIGHIFSEVKARPEYIIKECLNLELKDISQCHETAFRNL